MGTLRLPDFAPWETPRLPAWFPPSPAAWERQQAAQAAILPLPPPIPLDKPLSPRITAGLADRWYVLGKTRSGKTTFSKHLIKELRRLYPHVRTYALDSKGARRDFSAWPGLVTSERPPAPLRAPGGVQVWQPPYDDVEAYGAWMEAILKARQHAIVLIDELSNLSKTGKGPDYPVSLAKLHKQGAGLGICLLCLTQEAAYIPRQVRTQATHFVRFHIQDDAHAEAQAARLLDMAEPREPKRDHGFFYRNLDLQGPCYEYDGWQDFF